MFTKVILSTVTIALALEAINIGFTLLMIPVDFAVIGGILLLITTLYTAFRLLNRIWR